MWLLQGNEKWKDGRCGDRLSPLNSTLSPLRLCLSPFDHIKEINSMKKEHLFKFMGDIYFTTDLSKFTTDSGCFPTVSRYFTTDSQPVTTDSTSPPTRTSAFLSLSKELGSTSAVSWKNMIPRISNSRQMPLSIKNKLG